MGLSNFHLQTTTEQDTILVPAAADTSSVNELETDGYQVVEQSVQEQDSVAATITDSTPKTEKPSLAQIRYRQSQRESRLLINGERFMEPKTNINIVTSEVAPEKQVRLPFRTRDIYNADWLTLIFIVALALFASVRFTYSKYLNNLFQSIVNYATLTHMFEERSTSFSGEEVRLEIFFYLIFSVFLFQMVNFFHLDFPFQNKLLYLLILGAVLVYYMLKKLSYRIIGFIIEGREETGEYLFNQDNFNRAAGLILFPIVILVAFAPFKIADFLLFAGGFIFIIFYILLLGRGVSILFKKQFSIFYLFLYLCSLEFLPLLLIYKIVVV